MSMNEYFEKGSWGGGDKDKNQEQEEAEKRAEVLEEDDLEIIRTKIRELRSRALEKMDTEGPEAINKDTTLRQLISWEDEDIEAIPSEVLELWEEINNFKEEDKEKFANLYNKLNILVKEGVAPDRENLKESYRDATKSLLPILMQELNKKKSHKEAA